MDHVAIDLGGRESQVCIRSSDGTIIREERIGTTRVAALLATLPPSRVIVETCTEAFSVADAAQAVGHEIRVVPATLVKSLGVGARRTKNDRRDAQRLSEASCRMNLPSVHVASRRSRELKTRCGMREALVGARTVLVNTIRGWLRGQGWTLRKGYPESLPRRIRDQAISRNMELPPFIERQLQMIHELNLAIRDSDREVAKEARGDDVCRRLMTVPGVGPVTALRFVAAIDELGRFSDSHRVGAYLGLTPSERSSSDRQHRGGITKAGSPRMRWALVQAAWIARRYRQNDPMVQWAEEVAKRRGNGIATVALARKLSGILFAIWRDGTCYSAVRAASPAGVAQVPASS
jgi:transposase